MRTLFLVRHAKSSWTDPQLSDFERPLNARGLKAAPFMGELLRRNKLVPTTILSSPATRASSTAELIKKGGGFDAEIIFDRRVYEASTRALREVVADLSDKDQSVMLVGHNPGMEDFIRYVSDRAEPMPTAAVAVIDLELEHWAKIDAGCCNLREILRPRELMK